MALLTAFGHIWQSQVPWQIDDIRLLCLHLFYVSNKSIWKFSYCHKKREKSENSKEVSLTSTAAWAFGKKILYKLTLPIGAQEVGITATVTSWDAEDPVTPTVD